MRRLLTYQLISLKLALEKIFQSIIIQLENKGFDPNHCGMETSCTNSKILLIYCLIRTIVGWKLSSQHVDNEKDRRLIRTIVGWKQEEG